MGVPILSGCGFVVGVGWRCGPGASGGSLGVGFLGVRRWAAALAWMGYWWLLGAVFLATTCGAAGDACAGGRRLPAWRPHCSGVGPGGAWGSGGALPPGWGYGWAWGAWVLVGVPPGAWVGACAWARLWCGGLRCIGASAGGGGGGGGGGGSNRGGVNGLYLGVLLSFVVWELTEWWGGVVFPLLWGLVGRPGLPWALVWMAWAPRPGQIWGSGGAYGGQRGAGSKGRGILPPLMLSSPSLRLHFSRSITPTHR